MQNGAAMAAREAGEINSLSPADRSNRAGELANRIVSYENQSDLRAANRLLPIIRQISAAQNDGGNVESIISSQPIIQQARLQVFLQNSNSQAHMRTALILDKARHDLSQTAEGREALEVAGRLASSSCCVIS